MDVQEEIHHFAGWEGGFKGHKNFGEVFYLQLEFFCLQLRFFAYSPLGAYSTQFPTCKQKIAIVSKKTKAVKIF